MINEGESHKKQRLMQTPYTGAEAVGKLLKNFGQISEAVSRFGNTLNAIHIAAENIEHEFRNLASMMSMTRYSMSMSNNSPMYGAGAKRTNFPSPQERLIEFEVVEREKNKIRDQLKQERGEQPFKDNATRLEEYESFLEEKEKAYKSHKAKMDDLYKRDGKEPVTTETKINEYQKFLDEKFQRLQTYLKKEVDLHASIQQARGINKVAIQKVIFDYEESQNSQNKRNRKNKNNNNNSGSDYVSGTPDYSETPNTPDKKAAIVVLDFETGSDSNHDIKKDQNAYIQNADILQIAAEFRDKMGNVLETFNVFLDKRSNDINLPSDNKGGVDKFSGFKKDWQAAKDSGNMPTMEAAVATLQKLIQDRVEPGVTQLIVKHDFDTKILQNNISDKNKLLQPVLGSMTSNFVDIEEVFKQLFEKEKGLDPNKQSATQRAMAEKDNTSGTTNYDKDVFNIETMFAALKPQLEDLAKELNESGTDLGKFHNALGDVRVESLLYLFATRKLKTFAKDAAAKNTNSGKGSKGNTASSTNTSPKKPNNTYTSNGGVQKVEVVAPLPLPVTIVGGGGNFGGGGGNGGGGNGGNGAPPFTLTFPMVDDKWIEKSIEALRKERQNDEARKAGGKPASKKNTTNTTNDFSGGKPPAPNDNFVSDSIVDQIINGTKPSDPSKTRTGPTVSQPISVDPNAQTTPLASTLKVTQPVAQPPVVTTPPAPAKVTPSSNATINPDLTDVINGLAEGIKKLGAEIVLVSGHKWGVADAKKKEDLNKEDKRVTFFVKYKGKNKETNEDEDVILPMYRSSQGTSGKNKGSFYPYFGAGDMDWLVKGMVSEPGSPAPAQEDMLLGYNVDIIKTIQDFLSEAFKDFSAKDISNALIQLKGEPLLGANAVSKTLFGRENLVEKYPEKGETQRYLLGPDSGENVSNHIASVLEPIRNLQNLLNSRNYEGIPVPGGEVQGRLANPIAATPSETNQEDTYSQPLYTGMLAALFPRKPSTASTASQPVTETLPAPAKEIPSVSEPTPPPKPEAPLSKLDKLRAAQKDVATPEPVAPPKPKAKPTLPASPTYEPTYDREPGDGYYDGKHGIEFGFENKSSEQKTSSDFINNFIQGIPKQKVNGVVQPPTVLSDSMQDMMRAFQDIMLPVLNRAQLNTSAEKPGAEGTAAFDTLSDSAQKLVSSFQKMFGLDLTKISNFSVSAFGPDATKNNKSDTYVPQGLFNKQSGSIKIAQTANEKGIATDNSFGTLLHESIHAMFNQLRKQTKIPQLGQIANINFDDITGGNKEQLKAIEDMYKALVERAKTAFIESLAIQNYGNASKESINNATKDFEGMEYFKKPEELIATLIGDTFKGKEKQKGLFSGKNKSWLSGRRKPKDEENPSILSRGLNAVKNSFGFGSNESEEMADEQVNNKTSYSGDNSEVFKRDVSTASYEQLEADLERIGDLLQGPAKNSPLFLKMARTQEAKVKDQLAKLETIKRNTGEVVTPEQMDLEREAKLQAKSEKISKAPQTVSSDFYKGELAGSNAPPVVSESKKEEEKVIKTESNSEKNISGQKQERGENISLMEALSQSFDRLTGKAYKKGYDPNETFDKRSDRVSSIASGAKDKASNLLDNFNKVPGIIENALIASVKIPFTTKKQTDDERINGSKTYQYSGFKMDEQGNSIETKGQVTANSWQEAVKKVNEQSGIFVENLEELNGGIQGFIRNTLRPESAVLNQNDYDTTELASAKTAMQDNAMVNSNSDGSLTEEGQLQANSLLELISNILAVIRDKSIQGPIHPEMRQDFVGPRLPESESVPSVKDQRNLDTSIPDTVAEDIITKPGVNNSPTVPVHLLNNQSTTPNASPYSFSPLDLGALIDPNAKPDLSPSDTAGESSSAKDVNVLNIGDIKPSPAPSSNSSSDATRSADKGPKPSHLVEGGIIGNGVSGFIKKSLGTNKSFGTDQDQGPKGKDKFPAYLAENEAVLPEDAVKNNKNIVRDLLKGKKIKYMKKGGMGGGGSAPTASSSSATAAPKFDPRVLFPKGDIFGPIKQWVSDFANNTRLGFIGKSVMDFGKALQGTLNGLAGFVKAASPDVFSTLTGSIQLLMGAIGVQFIPIIIRVSAILQQWYQEILSGEGVLGEFIAKVAGWINEMPEDLLEGLVGIGLVVAGIVALAPVFAGLMAVVGIVAGGFSLMLTVITVVGTIIRGFGLMLGWGIGMVRAFGARLATAGGGTGFGAMMVGVARLIGPLAALLGAIKGITDYWNKKNLKDAEKKSQSLEEQEMETTVFKGEEEQKFAEERARLAGEGGKTKEEKVATLKKEEDHLFNEAQVKFEEAKKQSKGGGLFDKNTQVRPITETEAFKEYQAIKRKQNAVQQQREIEEGKRKGFTENAEQAGEEKKQKLREEFAILPGKTVNQYGQSKEVAEDHIKYRSGEIDKAVTKRSMNVTEGKSIIQPVQQGMANLGGGPVSLLGKELLGVVPELPKLPNMDDITAGFGDLNKKLKDAVSGLLTSGPNGKGKDEEYDRGVGLDKGLEKGRINDKEYKKQLEANNRRMTRIGTKDEAVDDRDNAIKFGKYNTKYTKQKEDDAEREKESKTKALAMSFSKEKAQASFSSVDEAYKKIQVSALGDDPMTAEMKKLNEVSMIRLLEELRGIRAGDKQNADKIVAGGGLAK